MLSNDEIGRFFNEADVRIQGNASLRDPQAEGHAAAVEFLNGGALTVDNSTGLDANEARDVGSCRPTPRRNPPIGRPDCNRRKR
jgi:hypothetical protein